MKVVARLLQFAAAAYALAAGAQSFPPEPPPPPTLVRAYEYANTFTGRHVWLADPAEMAGVDAGAAGPGWARNGYYFDSSQYAENRVDVCRFYAPGANSHFFTANAQECNALRANGQGWVYEKIAFRAAPPPAEFGCGGGEMYRLSNSRWIYNEPTHRFTPDRALRKRLIEAGWRDEGIAFCVDSWARETQRSWIAQADDGDGPRTDCEDPASNLGTCVMIRKLPAMPNTLPLPVGDLGTLTGFIGNGKLFTSQPVENTAAIRANSFVQVSRATTAGEPPWLFGFQLVGANRVASDLATLGVVHQFPTRAPDSPAQTDERVFPWSDGREHDLGLAFQIRVAVDAYPEDPAQSYGLGVLRFQDRATGHALMVTLQAWGRNPPANLVLRDAFTGQPIVSTFFQSYSGEPSFGTSEGAGYALCAGRCFVSGVHLSYLPYAFRIARADFLEVIAMARQVDPALSGDPADYLVSSFQFRGETYLDAAVAFAVYRLTLSVSK